MEFEKRLWEKELSTLNFTFIERVQARVHRSWIELNPNEDSVSLALKCRAKFRAREGAPDAVRACTNLVVKALSNFASWVLLRKDLWRSDAEQDIRILVTAIQSPESGWPALLPSHFFCLSDLRDYIALCTRYIASTPRGDVFAKRERDEVASPRNFLIERALTIRRYRELGPFHR